MNVRANVLLIVAALLLFNAGCQQNPTEPTATKTSTISGVVLDKGSSKPISLALVYDLGSLAKVDTSKLDGSYHLSMELSNNYTTSIYAKASGYASDTIPVTLKPGDNQTAVNIHMTIVDSNAVVAGNSGPPASIVLKSPTPGSIALKGTGINETAVLTFIVKDSAGNAVVGNNSCIVNFRLSARPDTLTFLNPTSAKSNRLSGEVSTTVSAGITPGVLQVIASTRGDTVKASPVFLSAGGGLPDSAGVSMGANPINIAGRVYGNLRSTITMFVNDRWGNPVANGTKVSFVTTAGSIVSSTTSQDGLANVTLLSTLNFPVNPLVTITATTNGDKYYRPSDSSIVRQMHILFSGPTAPIALDTSTTNRFDIPDGGTKFFNFRVSDDRGFPLIGGSTITISIDGADTLTKNLAILGSSFTFGDVQSPAWTFFTVGIVDKLLGGASGSIVIGIHVSSTNGNADCWFGGRVLPSGAVSGPTFNGPASIAAVDTISKKLYLLETQRPDTLTKLTFIVKDAYNAPMQSTNKAQVQFFLSGSPDGVHFYPSMTTQPVFDSTDAKGTVSVTVISGNTPGTFSVHARTTNGVNIYDAYSVPIIVRHGLPDSNFISSDIKKNIFNPKRSVKVGTFTLNLEDYTSDIPAPTNVLFSTTGGSIGAQAISDSNTGKAVVNLYGGSEPSDPTLGPGWGYIKPTLLVHGGSTITEYFPFLFSYAPQIAITSISVMNTTLDTLAMPLGDGQSVYVNFAVWDKNKNPISSANSITVSASPSQNIVLGGDINLTSLKDSHDSVDAIHNISIQNKSGVGPFSVTITVTGESGSARKTIYGTMAATTGIGTRVKSLQFVSSSNTPVYVRNTGLSELTTLTFALIDSNQHSVILSKADTVLFSILGGTGQEQLSTTAVLSNALGQVSTVFSTGTKSGTFTVLAQVKNLPTIQATYDVTIIGGFPDPNKFTMQWAVTPPDSLLNLPGLVLNTALANINILTLDKYSNPAKPSVIQFDQTSGGSVIAVTTDISGRAGASLSGGKPYPNEPSIGSEYGLVGPNRGFGFGFVKARTLGENGVFVRDSLMFLFTGSPIVTTSVDTVFLSDGGSQNFGFTISDVYGKMIATLPSSVLTISVKVEGPAMSSIVVESDLPSKLPSNPVFPTTYHLKLTDNTPNGGVSGNFTITIGVDGPLGHKEKVVNGILHGATASAPTQLVITSISNNIVAANGSGGLNTSFLTFQALDPSGRPIDISMSDTVFFTISDTSGGSYLIPTFALTDASGQASTRFYGGTKYGSPTVTAKMKSFSSLPQTIRISGPSITNFNATVSATNLPGMSKIGSVVGTVNVQLGDSLGNPVSAGTLVKFSTSGGMVDPSAVTGAGGSAMVNLYGGAAPTDPTIGWGNVTVQAQGNNSVTLQKKVPFLFSGQPKVSTLNVPASDSILILTKSSVDVDYKIADINRNPLAAGSTVQVSVTGAAASYIAMVGYSAFTTDGTTDTNATVFRVTLLDKQINGETGGNFDATITVNGPNGSASRLIHGYLQAPGTIGGSTTDSISSIICTSSSVDISVQSTGKPETATLIFIGKDKSGQPVDLAHGSIVSFAISPPTLGASLTITSVKTDGAGQAITLVRAGTISGAIQVIASAVVNGVTIRSLPVNISINSGLPDQRHFTLGAQFYNFPGLDYNGTLVPVTLFMADKYSNPVSIGTTGYFYSTHGKVATIGSVSSTIGNITQNLYSQNPRPDPSEIDASTGVSDTVSFGPQNQYKVKMDQGWTRVYAQSYNDAGGIVEDSIYILWTGIPYIDNTGLSGGSVGYNSSISGFSFRVWDRFGHPMSKGTTITVTCGNLKVATDAPSGGMPDVTPGGPGASWQQSVMTAFNVTVSGNGSAPSAASDNDLIVTVVHPLYGTYSATIAVVTELTTP